LSTTIGCWRSHGAALSDDEDEASDEGDDEQEMTEAACVSPAVHTPPQMPVAALSGMTAQTPTVAPPADLLSDEDKALQAALAASQKEFELEQERQRQQRDFGTGASRYVQLSCQGSRAQPGVHGFGRWAATSNARSPRLPPLLSLHPVAMPVVVPPADMPPPAVVPELPSVLPAPAGKESVAQHFYQSAGFGNLDVALAADGIPGRDCNSQLGTMASSSFSHLSSQAGSSRLNSPCLATRWLQTAEFTTFSKEPGSYGADGYIDRAPAGPAACRGGYAPMAAGHQVVATAVDEDDDLTSLLQSCGVAG